MQIKDFAESLHGSAGNGTALFSHMGKLRNGCKSFNTIPQAFPPVCLPHTHTHLCITHLWYINDLKELILSQCTRCLQGVRFTPGDRKDVLGH